jgi:hypothetical protein
MAIPVKPEYGPTLGRLLEPRWRAGPPMLRALTYAALVALVALAVAVFLHFRPSSFSHGGPVPFHLHYRGLTREPAGPGEYLRLAGRDADGSFKYSYVAEPLRLPPYAGLSTGELALYASRYIRTRTKQLQGFELEGEGKTRVNGIGGYEVLYTATVEGKAVFGRDVMLLPERPAVREGVTLVLMAAQDASKEVAEASEVASTEPLLRPVKTFAFG